MTKNSTKPSQIKRLLWLLFFAALGVAIYVGMVYALEWYHCEYAKEYCL